MKVNQYFFLTSICMKISRFCKKLLLVLFVAIHPVSGQVVDFSAPSQIVNELHENLLVIMKNAENLGYKGRYQHMKSLVSTRFNTPLIVKVILSRYWDELSEENEIYFIELFNKLSIATYAFRFNNYDGQKFVEI